jgi:hypothetical protein
MPLLVAATTNILHFLRITYVLVTGMQAAYDLLWGSPGVANSIRAVLGCENMTNADLISIAGYVAVVQAGGVAKGGCGWYPGRYIPRNYHMCAF